MLKATYYFHNRLKNCTFFFLLLFFYFVTIACRGRKVSVSSESSSSDILNSNAAQRVSGYMKLLCNLPFVSKRLYICILISH